MIQYRCHIRERTCSRPPCPVSSWNFFTRRLETGESRGRRTGCLTSSETGAFPIRPPTLTIPFTMIGSRGANLLLFVRQPLPDSRDAISKAKDLAWTYRTIVISASRRSSALNENVRGSEPTFLLKECCKPFTARRIKATNLRNLNQSKMSKNPVKNLISLLSRRGTHNLLQLWILVINLVRIWLKWPLTVCAPEKTWSALPPLTLKQCFPIKASWGVICWIELWWHIVPLPILRQLVDYCHPVGDEGIKPCLLVLHIAEDRSTIAPEMTVLQQKRELWTKLFINLSSNYGTGQLHPWDGHLFEWSNSRLATNKAAVVLIILVDET